MVYISTKMKAPIQVILRRRNFEKAAARANLQKGEIAEKINVSQTYFSRIIAGRDQLSPRRRKLLLDLFGVGFDHFFYVRAVDKSGNMTGDNRIVGHN